jgi:DnaK suppressor protein
VRRIESYRFALREKKAEVLSALGIKFDTLAALGRVAEDDQAQISHDEFISLRMNSLVYEKLRLVDEALLRIDRGEFGICARCEQPIPEKRLRALPWARYCLPCQEVMSRLEDTEVEPHRHFDPVGTF